MFPSDSEQTKYPRLCTPPTAEPAPQLPRRSQQVRGVGFRSWGGSQAPRSVPSGQAVLDAAQSLPDAGTSRGPGWRMRCRPPTLGARRPWRHLEEHVPAVAVPYEAHPPGPMPHRGQGGSPSACPGLHPHTQVTLRPVLSPLKPVTRAGLGQLSDRLDASWVGGCLSGPREEQRDRGLIGRVWRRDHHTRSGWSDSGLCPGCGPGGCQQCHQGASQPWPWTGRGHAVPAACVGWSPPSGVCRAAWTRGLCLPEPLHQPGELLEGGDPEPPSRQRTRGPGLPAVGLVLRQQLCWECWVQPGPLTSPWPHCSGFGSVLCCRMGVGGLLPGPRVLTPAVAVGRPLWLTEHAVSSPLTPH